MTTVTIERETLEQWRAALARGLDWAQFKEYDGLMKKSLASMDAALAQPQAAQPPPYCNICEGRGEVDTGIDESPVTICNSCNGTGIAQTAQPPRELVQHLVDVLTAEPIRCDALTAGRAWLEANAELCGGTSATNV